MRLVRTDRQGSEGFLEAEGENVVLGRNPGRGITVEDPTVSREHARIFVRGGTFQVADLNSSNGTFVNGKRITRSELRAGDLLRLGSVELRFEPGEAAAGQDELQLEDPGAAAMDPVAPAAPPPPRPAVPSGHRPGNRTVLTRTNTQPLTRSTSKEKRSAGLLRQDMSQQSFLRRALLVLVALAIAAGLFLLSQRLTEKLVPEEGFGGPDTGIEETGGG
ncbi:MAG: FHA domain-containing protein [Planctomycetota bacterium]